MTTRTQVGLSGLIATSICFGTDAWMVYLLKSGNYHPLLGLVILAVGLVALFIGTVAVIQIARWLNWEKGGKDW